MRKALAKNDIEFRFPAVEVEAALAAYCELGFCVISGLISAEDCAGLYGIYDEYQAKAARGEGDVRWLSDDTAWDIDTNSVRILRKVPKPFQNEVGFRAVFARDDILDIIERFVGPDIYLHSSKMLYKPPRTGRPKPPHQDLAYWEDMSARQVTLWCPVDRATAENGCIELYRGMHKSGLIPHEDLDDWQIAPGRLTEAPLVVEMEPGEMLLLHPLAPHASRPNVSDKGRLAAVINFYSEPQPCSATARYGADKPIRGRC